MATKVKVDLEAMKESLRSVSVANTKTKNDIGEYLDRETKRRIEKGVSPVKGVGRFPGYAVQRKGSGYPDVPGIKRKYPSKNKRPINLYLDGSFLSRIGYNLSKTGVFYGLQTNEKFYKDLFDTHNNGTHPDVPQRRFVPVDEGETYTPDIIRGIRDIYNKRIRDIIRKLNE